MESQKVNDRSFSLYAEYKKGTSYKFYKTEIALDDGGYNYDVIVSYGRIGTKGNSMVKYSGQGYWTAKGLCERLFQAKLDKGYEKVSALEAIASSCSSPEEIMEDSGWEQIVVEIPSWETGSNKTDERLNSLCEKAVTRLNLLTKALRDTSLYEWSERRKIRRKMSDATRSMQTAFANTSAAKTHKSYINADTRGKFEEFSKNVIIAFGVYY